MQGAYKGNMALDLTFDSGAFYGAGGDIVGPFQVGGAHDESTGSVTFKKVYKRHRVQYQGTWDGILVTGTWRMILGSGTFELWPSVKHEE